MEILLFLGWNVARNLQYIKPVILSSVEHQKDDNDDNTLLSDKSEMFLT